MMPFVMRFSNFNKALVLLSLVAVVSASCSGGKQTPTDRGPMILFAIDGMEWRVAKPLLDAGELPVLERLMNRGTFGYLRSMKPTLSPSIWTTIATGKPPVSHGIKNFIYESSPGSGVFHYYTSGHRQTKALWNMLSDYGLTSMFLGWWMTFPAEEIEGVMVSQTNTVSVLIDNQKALWKGSLFKGVEGQVYPVTYQNTVMTLLENVNTELDDITTDIFGQRQYSSTEFAQLMWDQTQWAFRADATYLRVADDLLGSGQPFDLFSIYLGGPDVSAHRFWRYKYPEEFKNKPAQEQIENYGDVIDDYYRYVDRSMGALIDKAPSNATIIIVSDHGMEAFNTDGVFRVGDPPEKTTSAHHLDAPPGVFVAAGSPFKPTAPGGMTAQTLDLDRMKVVGSVLDIAPTLLWIKGLPNARDMAGIPMKEVLDPGWVAAHPIENVDSYDDEAWLASREDRIRDAVDQNERVEQLRSLGYIK